MRSILGTHLGGYLLYGLAAASLVIFQFYWLGFKSYRSTGAANYVISGLNNSFGGAKEIFIFNSPEYGFGINSHNFTQFFYYNPVKSLGENALLREPKDLPQVVVYNFDNVKNLLPEVGSALEDNYIDYKIINSDSEILKVRKDYARNMR